MEIIQRVVKENLPISDEALQINQDNMDDVDLLSTVVIKFSTQATQATIDWLIELIKAPGIFFLLHFAGTLSVVISKAGITY